MFGKKTIVAEKKSRARKSPLREWVDSVLFAVIAATLIRFLVMEAFAIPTPSMESNLMVGDYLFVSKLHYGSRTPQTPLQLPLTHQKIWGTNIPSFSTAIQLPTFRLPGFTHVKNGDVVVFNYPPLRPNEPDYPKDLRTNYIKRCIGIAGDVVQIKQEQVFINGKATALPERAQTTWFIKTTEVLDDRFFRQYDIVNDFNSPEGPFINWQPVEVQNAATNASELIGYRINTTRAMLDKIKALDWVKGVEPLTEPAGQTGPGIYGSSVYAWNQDNFGPLTVPKKGMTVPVNRETIAVYGPVISRYEDNARVVQTPTSITIDGKPVTEYTFKQDYYFMMGDNRHNSEDSRYWGFVPEDHVVGKAVFVWMSADPAPENIWHKIRWNRLFRVIN
ncbi:signal peptidase I [Arsenicibacter rosenii]|uniref:Signal peptidase I n=1 Tax=Arsenicibacter rosenii TaxID=1750698 RepID=A0A1S2VDW5_9BACT|nr:signal peptidase I [Arsenicibacter rosenii]OIN56882.1 S26 family signal peptidase [Arsenicibacter rosenii]